MSIFWDARFAASGYACGTEPNGFLRAVLRRLGITFYQHDKNDSQGTV